MTHPTPAERTTSTMGPHAASGATSTGADGAELWTPFWPIVWMLWLVFAGLAALGFLSVLLTSVWMLASGTGR